MEDIEHLQERLVAAMSRLGKALEQLPDASALSDMDQLRAELEQEKHTSAVLRQQLQALTEQHEKDDNVAQAIQGRMVDLDQSIQRLRQSGDELRASNAALRKANADGVGEPGLINEAMTVEIEALRATRDADMAEADAIFDALWALVQSGGVANEMSEPKEPADG